MARGSFWRRKAATSCFSAIGLALCCSAFAESPADSLDEVVVTARKRTENAQQVPISMTIRSGQALTDRGEFRAQEILRSMPNVSTEVQQPRQASIAIRGIGKSPANEGLEGSVGVFVDGVYQGRTGMAVNELVDLERIEVLRGPQGTLFGKNTTAGALNVVSRAPVDALESWGQVSLGNEDFLQINGAINTPIVPERLAFRLAAFETVRQGLIVADSLDQRIAEYQRQGARAQLLWTPSESTRLRFIADYSIQDEDGPGYLLVDPAIIMADGSVRPNNFLDRSARAGYAPVFDPFARRTDAEGIQHVDSEQGGFSLQADVRISGLLLTSISAWRKFSFEPQVDGDYSALDILPLAGITVRHQQVSQELRLSSDTETQFDYMLGAYFFAQEIQANNRMLYGSQAADFSTAGLTPLALDGYRVSTRANPETDSIAAFAQGTWRPADAWELTAGARWTGEERTAHIARVNSGGAPLPPTNTAALLTRERIGGAVESDAETSEDFVSGLLSARFQISESSMAYLSASRGAKSGGINVAILAPGVDPTLRPETANAIELGWKSQWLGQTLQLNLATFWMDIEDYQATLRDWVRNVSYLTNAGSVRSRGFELETLYRVSPRLELSLTGGWNDASYTSFTDAPCPTETVNPTTCDLSGHRVVGAPPWTATGAVRFDTPVGSADHRMFADVEYTHTAAHKLDMSNYTHIDSYGLATLQFGIQGADDRWRAWIWGKNLLDEEYFTSLATAGAFMSGAVIGVAGDPRTFGLSVRGRL